VYAIPAGGVESLQKCTHIGERNRP